MKDKKDLKAFGKMLTNMRIRSGIKSRRQLSIKTGVSDTHIGNLEKGKNRPSKYLLWSIVAVLDLTSEEIVEMYLLCGYDENEANYMIERKKAKNITFSELLAEFMRMSG